MSAPPSATVAPKPRVICVGMSTLDYTWTLEQPVETMDAKVRATGFLPQGGGMAATAAVAVARLGGEAQYWGRAGDDAAGRAMRDELAGFAVDVRQFRLFPGAHSPVSGIVVSPSGDRLIVNFRGAEVPTVADWLPLDAVASAGAVLGDPRWLDGVVAAFSKARAVGVPTVLDAEVSDGSLFERLLPLTDHAVFSAPALASFAGDDIAAGLARVAGHGCRVAAVTRGSGGVDWIDAGGRHHLAARRVDTVDTTGAGDVFHGAYALAIARGDAVPDAMRFAAAAAALKCTKPGGRAGIPDLAEAISFQRTEE